MNHLNYFIQSPIGSSRIDDYKKILLFQKQQECGDKGDDNIENFFTWCHEPYDVNEGSSNLEVFCGIESEPPLEFIDVIDPPDVPCEEVESYPEDYSVMVTTKKRKVMGMDGGFVPLPSKEEKNLTSSEINDYLYGNVNYVSQVPNFGLNFGGPQYYLHIGQQPPVKIVYNRILKPFPAVMLKENNYFNNNSQFFVDVFLIKNNDTNNVLPYLEGKGPKPISNNNYCVFDKLKITSTSKSNKCQFKLLFQLIQFDGIHYNTVPNVSILSNPVEVVSHSNYLKEDKKSYNKPSPPVISCVIPESGRAGDRCVIIGSNFINSKSLCVKFGEKVIKPEFHESMTLIINIPVLSSKIDKVELLVSNDGEEFCGGSVHFKFV